MKTKRIALDIDGVFANFNKGWANLARELHGVEYPAMDDTYPDKWHYWPDRLNKEQTQTVLDKIEKGGFWSLLEPYPDAKKFMELAVLHSPIGIHTYFITQRNGRWVKWETELWLHALGVLNPTVLLVDKAEDKIPMLDALGIDAFMEDNLETAKLARASKAYVYLLDRPWNRAENPDGVIRIYSVIEFLQRVLDIGHEEGKILKSVAGMK